MHLAVNSERLAALTKLSSEEALLQHDMWLLSVAKVRAATLGDTGCNHLLREAATLVR